MGRVKTVDPAQIATVVPDLGQVDRDVGQFGTELIMSKTFTESTHPGREFVPIRGDTRADDDDVTRDDVIVDPLPVGSSLTVRCELVSQPPTETTSGVTSSGQTKTTSGSQSAQRAVGQVSPCSQFTFFSDFKNRI